jgi:hypothetical protein
MLRGLLDVAPAQSKPHSPLRAADPRNQGGRDDVVSVLEMMGDTDNEVALAWCVTRPGHVADLAISGLDPEVLDAVIGANHPERE